MSRQRVTTGMIVVFWTWMALIVGGLAAMFAIVALGG
jgi:hypothetical protein